MAIALIVTPSLAYMAEATSLAGWRAFGVGYGMYNVGVGGGPAVGTRARRVALRPHRVRGTDAIWAPVVTVATIVIRVGTKNRDWGARRLGARHQGLQGR